MSSATDMFTKAVDHLRGAEVLNAQGNPHSALLLAIHGGINAADAIGYLKGDPYTGTDHRGAADHLRKLDTVELRKPAQSLRRLVDKKSTASYREGRYTSNQTLDAINDCRVLVNTAADVLGMDAPYRLVMPDSGNLADDLAESFRVLGIDAGAYPWMEALGQLRQAHI